MVAPVPMNQSYAVNTLNPTICEHNNVYNLVQATIERLTNSAELESAIAANGCFAERSECTN